MGQELKPMRAQDREPATESGADQFDRFARYYDGDYRNYDDDVDAVVDLAQQAEGPVLELGCGTGRLLGPLAAAGCNVTGVDISPALLAVAARKLQAATRGGQVSLVQGDMRALDLPQQEYAFAFAASNTFMHVTTADEQLATLRSVYRHLRSGGLLLLVLFNPDVLRMIAVNGVMELADQWEDAKSGSQVLKWSVRTVDWAEQLQDTLFIYEEVATDGSSRRTLCPFLLRFLWRSEAELLLRAAGFEVDGVWGDFYGNPYDLQSDYLILLAKKTE
jgi:SAM-dependent methyltransferase